MTEQVYGDTFLLNGYSPMSNVAISKIHCVDASGSEVGDRYLFAVPARVSSRMYCLVYCALSSDATEPVLISYKGCNVFDMPLVEGDDAINAFAVRCLDIIADKLPLSSVKSDGTWCDMTMVYLLKMRAECVSI